MQLKDNFIYSITSTAMRMSKRFLLASPCSYTSRKNVDVCNLPYSQASGIIKST